VNACEGVIDVHSKTSKSLAAESVFQASTMTPGGLSVGGPSVSRTALARYLHFDATGGRFGGLRPAFFGGEIRWVCPAHYDEMSAMPPSK